MLRCTICFLLLLCSIPRTLSAQVISAPQPQPGTITGTVKDTNGGLVPGAIVSIDSANPGEGRVATANGEGFFSLSDAPSAIAVQIKIHAEGFKDWVSPSISLTPGQMYDMTEIKLSLLDVEITVDAISSEELAKQQVQAEEKQRLLGVIPNFYVTYDHNAQPLTAKLKFQMAFKTATDPATFGGAVFLGSLYQAADTPDYRQGMAGYGQRVGAIYANGFSDIMIGGAILPSLLHQDPRYFYQGTGSTKSRIFHAVSAPFIAKGDNGRQQFNYSSIGGDLASGTLSNLYYPNSNRGTSMVFNGALITTSARIANALAQEFLLHKLTSKTQVP